MLFNDMVVNINVSMKAAGEQKDVINEMVK